VNKRILVALAIGGLFVGTSYGQWANCATGPAGSQCISSTTASAGIGVTGPVSKFEVLGSTTNSSGKFGSYEIQSYAVNNAWLSENIYYDSGNGGFHYRSTGFGALSYFFNGGFAIRTVISGTAGALANPIQRFIVQQDGTIGLGGSQTDSFVTGSNMVITSAGNVGIGVPVPTQKLDVAGSINISGNINAKYQDFAEWVNSSVKIEAGTVVVLDPTRNNEVIPSTTSYDTSAAGVISVKPGISLGEPSPSKVQVATSGRVRVKVDATKSPIKIGDLLVTSDKPGMAMKSQPVNVNGIKMHRPGTLIGKALEPLDKGEGEILVLLSMQ
jgi:hypothetical protein